MNRRLLAIVAVAALAGAACGRGGPAVRAGELPEDAFVVQVADFEANAGPGLAMTTDKDGNPHLVYLSLPEEPKKGEAVVPPAIGDPVPPFVKHAHYVGGAWTRSVVADEQNIDANVDQAAIAVDAQGVHHVAWTSGDAILYASNGPEGFADPVEVADGALPHSVSIAVDGEGTPWIAFVQPSEASSADLIRVATLSGDTWVTETAAEARAPEPPTTAIAAATDGPVVAFADRAAGKVARRTADGWVAEDTSTGGEGASGIALALDADGNPHVALFTYNGDVLHSHSIAGTAWEASEVGHAAEDGSPTSIALDAEGVHHIAWQTADGIAYATNEGGEFAEADPPPGSEGGALPKVAAGPEGVAFLAWYDPKGTEVMLGVHGGEEPLLAVPTNAPTVAPTAQPTGPPACEPTGTELAITAKDIAFDTDCLAAPAGEPFTIAFDNQDANLPHNVAIYESQGGAALFQPALITGPAQEKFEVGALEAGQFFFQCDAHADSMSGTFVVA